MAIERGTAEACEYFLPYTKGFAIDTDRQVNSPHVKRLQTREQAATFTFRKKGGYKVDKKFEADRIIPDCSTVTGLHRSQNKEKTTLWNGLDLKRWRSPPIDALTATDLAYVRAVGKPRHPVIVFFAQFFGFVIEDSGSVPHLSDP